MSEKKILTIEDRIRADNLKRFIEENYNNNISSFSRDIGFTESQSNNLGNSLKGNRPFGLSLALKVETALKFPAGLLSTLNCHFPDKQPDMINIPTFKAEASAGHGSHIFSEDFMIEPTTLPRSFLTNSGVNPKNLLAITVDGDSMQPEIKHKAIVILDTSEKTRMSIQDGSVYCFRLHTGKRKIKYLYMGINGLILRSANKAYPDDLIPMDTEHDLIIEGKVIFVINPFF